MFHRRLAANHLTPGRAAPSPPRRRSDALCLSKMSETDEAKTHLPGPIVCCRRDATDRYHHRLRDETPRAVCWRVESADCWPQRHRITVVDSSHDKRDFLNSSSVHVMSLGWLEQGVWAMMHHRSPEPRLLMQAIT